MKQMLKFVMVLVVVTTFPYCQTIDDVPEVKIEKESYTVAPEGGTLHIPVLSTGIDQVRVSYRESYYEWETNPENGDLYPVDGWITIERVINNYPETRDLPSFRQGVSIRFAPNNSGVERQAIIEVISFTASDVVLINQPSLPIEN